MKKSVIVGLKKRIRAQDLTWIYRVGQIDDNNYIKKKQYCFPAEFTQKT